MIYRRFLFPRIFFCIVICSSVANAAPITWIAQSPNNNMDNPISWSPSTVPGSGDDAIFNSKLSGLNKNPTENSSPFSVSTLNFPFNASSFTFNFNNESLTFNGAGITGSNTNPIIHVINTNNSFFPGDLVSFVGVVGTSGSSAMTISNSGTLTGNLSGSNISAINSNLHSTGDFIIANGGSITASNSGNDSTNGTGNNGTANTGASLLQFDQSFTAGNNVAISQLNNGIFSGTNTVQGDGVAIVNGSQFRSSGAFQVGNNFNCEIQNTGNDSSLGVGLSNIGQLNAAQMVLQTTGTVGSNCHITISNTGTNSSQTTSFSDNIGYLNDQQFFVGNAFQANDNFSLTVNNTGTDTSNGHGGYQVAVINSNSGTTGNQVLFQQGCTLGNHATIDATNKGTYSGTNTSGGSNVAGMNLQQIVFGDSTSIGSYSFTAGDDFSLSASNSGIDSSTGTGANAVGTVSSDQISFFTPVALGNHATVTLTNSGNFSGDISNTYANVGSTGGIQLNCASSVSTGNDFTLNVSNSGTHTGSGIGGCFVGDIISGQQVAFQNNFIIGNNASIEISNEGSNSSTTSNNLVACLLNYGKQLLLKDQFLVGDDFFLTITNSGFDDSTGLGGNFTGFINNNTLDGSASQIHLIEGGSLGDRASITLSNTGTYQGSNTALPNSIGVLAQQQLYSVNDFHAGNNFVLTVSNSGVNLASGQTNNTMGAVGGSQIQFGGACVIGDNAFIGLSNSGTNNDSTGTSNYVGIVNGSQMLVDGDFTVGTAFNLTANNTMVNEGDSTNLVGSVISQIIFVQNCTLNDGTVISAFNSGMVTSSQIEFGQGFNVANGKATIQAINQGVVGAFGIDIQGSNAGGNANIELGNSFLNIGTTLSTFTIAGLDGDSTSIVQSKPQLIIDTDALTQAEFSGVIQDFIATNSQLIKTGPGSQKLSGINTYTGLTTLQEGTLVVNGTLAGDVLTNPFGTLKGNGTILGTLTNTGTVSPGESIGILTVGNYINNNGVYAVEVNGLGQSDLIDVLGIATLNGGTVVVSSVDGTFRFQQPYTIITAEDGVVGTFTDATSLAFVTPVLTYDPNNVYLTLQSALLNAADGCNQVGVATTLDHLVAPNATQSLLIGTIANLPLAAAQDALESLSGFQYTHDVLVTDISTSRFLRRLYDPLRPLVTKCDRSSPCDAESNEWTTWLDTGYGYTTLHGNTAHKLNFDSYQVTGGLQKTFCNNFTLGLAGSYEYDHVNYRDGKANRNTEFASVYGLYRPNAFYGLVDLVYGYSSHHFKRTIGAGDLSYQAHSKPNFNTVSFYGEAGFDLPCQYGLIQPFLGIQIGKNWRNRINESQINGLGLAINKHEWTTTRSRLGLHLSTCNFCDCIDTSLDIAWNQLLSSSKNSTKGRFEQFGDSFAICGNRLDNYSFDYALTFTTCFCGGLEGYLELNGEWWQHASTFNAIGGIQYSW